MPFRASGTSGGEDLAGVVNLDDPLLDRDRMDHSHVMMRQQRGQFALDGRKAAGLDLDQQVTAHDVDNEAVNGLFEGVARLAVPALEVGVQGLRATCPRAAR